MVILNAIKQKVTNRKTTEVAKLKIRKLNMFNQQICNNEGPFNVQNCVFTYLSKLKSNT